MKQSLKKLVVITSMAMLILIYFGCINGKWGNNKISLNNEANEVISDYIVNYNVGAYYKTDKQFEAHKVYGTEEKDGLINVYMYSRFQGFTFVDGGFEGRTSGEGPVLVKLKKENNKYSVVEYNEGDPVHDDEESLKKIFPKRYIRKALHDSGHSLNLHEQINTKAREWLKLQGKDLKIIR